MCFLWLRKNQRDPNVLVPRQGGAIPEPERRGGECGAQVCRQRPLPQESALRNTAHGHSWQRAQQGTYSSSELGGDESIDIYRIRVQCTQQFSGSDFLPVKNMKKLNYDLFC